MTRATDVAPPTLTPHPIGPDAPIAKWPYWPVVGLEMLDAAAYTWDDADPAVVWSATGDPYVWDAPFTVSGFYDAVCDLIALDIDPGEPDELYLFPPVQCTITLDNRTGRYTPWTADGRLTYWAPGRKVCVWVRQGSARWWLFSGRVATWQANPDQTVTVTAFDGLSWLAQTIAGGQWTPGAAGQTVTQRIQAVVAAAGYTGRVDIDAGTVAALTTWTMPAAVPLEAIQQTALSDGGLFYGDADGSLDYRNRLWRAGRTDAPAWVVSTNVCTVPVILWNPEAAADDDRLVTDVALVNTAGLTAAATLTGSLWAGDARFRLTHPDPDLWTSQADGNALAAYLLAQQSNPSMALSSFDLYALDPVQQPAVSDMAAQLRRGDRVRVIHEFVDGAGITQTLDVYAVCLGVHHVIEPDRDGWVATVNLTRTVDTTAVELWDRTSFVWNDANALAVWRY